MWRQDDEPDGLYIIQSGVLRAVYHFADHTSAAEETMVAGTVAGELSALSGSTRNATCTVEREAVVWKLSVENLRKMETERPELANAFTKLALKGESLSCRILVASAHVSIQPQNWTTISCSPPWLLGSNGHLK